MDNKIKNIITCCVFFVMIGGFMVYSMILPDTDLSKSERRKLEKLPKISVEKVMDGSYLTKFERYAQEQFPFRDNFRGLKSFVALDMFKKQDNNNLFVKDGAIYRLEYPLNEKSVSKAAYKFNTIYDMYLNDSNKCYYAVIPDKSYFTAKDKLYMDYDKLESILQENVKNMEYINLFDVLSENDYYATDSHWKQENLQKVVNTLGDKMGFKPANFEDYTLNTAGRFNGVYHGQLSMNIKSDRLNYLTNNVLENATVYNHEAGKEMPVYTLEKYKTDVDPYNIFLNGPITMVTLTNNMAQTDKELIIFRDSFSSSISPMLLESYKSVTLIDLRYIAASLLKDKVDFENKDILFMYSTTILNNSTSLKL